MTIGSLMKVESIAEMSPWSILQYFWPALSDNWSRFFLFESGRFTYKMLFQTTFIKEVSTIDDDQLAP